MLGYTRVYFKSNTGTINGSGLPFGPQYLSNLFRQLFQPRDFGEGFWDFGVGILWDFGVRASLAISKTLCQLYSAVQLHRESVVSMREVRVGL